MKNFKSHFVLNKQQRSGIFILMVLVIAAFAIDYLVDFRPKMTNNSAKITIFQKKIDSLKALKIADTLPKIYPFNPNFITDYKGYVLGMKPTEIDKLHRYRESNKWINSANDFKEVTGISDSLLGVISPHFKFPEWVTNPKPKTSYSRTYRKSIEDKDDLNEAGVDDLLLADGLTEALAIRIINYRKRLGGFLEDNQLFDVYGLPNAMVYKIKDLFAVKTKPEIERINVNQANASDLATIAYITFDMARAIINYRELHEGIADLDELLKIDGMTTYKLERIKLYLSTSHDL